MKKTTGRPPLDDDDPDAVPVCVKLPPRQYDALYRRSQRARVSVPEVIRRDVAAASAATKRREPGG